MEGVFLHLHIKFFRNKSANRLHLTRLDIDGRKKLKDLHKKSTTSTLVDDIYGIRYTSKVLDEIQIVPAGGEGVQSELLHVRLGNKFHRPVAFLWGTESWEGREWEIRPREALSRRNCKTTFQICARKIFFQVVGAY